MAPGLMSHGAAVLQAIR